mmetsp:Transcript_106455/g.206120  ORF Transcript_106455/g.206120 Transcript_106455/m.206120 type:complete len:170 (-) Transcript_106455:77-586(-)
MQQDHDDDPVARGLRHLEALLPGEALTAVPDSRLEDLARSLAVVPETERMQICRHFLLGRCNNKRCKRLPAGHPALQPQAGIPPRHAPSRARRSGTNAGWATTDAAAAAEPVPRYLCDRIEVSAAYEEGWNTTVVPEAVPATALLAVPAEEVPLPRWSRRCDDQVACDG